MNSPSELSLSEIALSVAPSAQILQVSPATFKSAIDGLMDLLTEQQIPAVLWAKLPKGSVWQTGLELYGSLSGVNKVIYQFKSQRDEGSDDASMVSTAMTASPESLSSREGSIESLSEHIINLYLPPGSSIRREYFLLVWSSQFQAVILSQRVRSTAFAKTAVESKESRAAAGEPGLVNDDPSERRQQLLMLYSFDTAMVESILSGLEQVVTQTQLPIEATENCVPQDFADLVNHWRTQLSNLPPLTLNPSILSYLLNLQIQRQDEVWQRYSVYRKQAEIVEALQYQNEELTNAIRFKDDFLSNVGQELRTPLTTIKTALTLLNSPNVKQPQRQRYMDLIAKECDRQSSLITSLLDLVQLDQVVEQSTLQPVRLSDVVPGVVSTYQPVAEEKGVMLAYTVPEDLPPVSCMNNWLKQIVINLLHNGIKFTPNGGQVWVRAKQQGDYVQLEFRDTGIGIAPTEVSKIFERFYRVRQSVEESSGAGLGLTIVQQLLIHCGGSVSVKSRLGEGSSFNVLLPIHRIASDFSTGLEEE
jgi:signal transduction histidine kinase